MQGVPSFLSLASVPMATNLKLQRSMLTVNMLISSHAGNHFIIALKLCLHIAEVLILHHYCHNSCDLRSMSCEVECSVCDYLKDGNDFPEWLLRVFIFSVNSIHEFSAYLSQSRWEQAKQSRSSVLPKHVLKLFLGDCKASPDHMSVPSPPKGLLTFEHAQNTSAGTYLGCILIRCPNHLI